MTGARLNRWNTVHAKLKEARETGHLGVVAASLAMPEYKLHDLAKLEESRVVPVSPYELKKLYGYFTRND